MRLGIKGKQVLGVTSIVGAVVVLLSLFYLSRLASVSLDESNAHAGLLVNAIYHRARAVVDPTAANPYAGLSTDPGLRSILESSAFSRYVTSAAITNAQGIVVVAANESMQGRKLPRAGDLAELLERRPLRQLLEIYRGQTLSLELKQPLRLGNTEFGSIHIGVSTLLIRKDIDDSLNPAVATALAALAISVIVAMLLAQLLLRPIHVIRSGLTRLGRGEFGVRLDLNQHDEFGELGTFFNAVSEQLSADRSLMAGQVANLESAVEHLEDAVAIVNAQGELLFTNPAMRILLPGAAPGTSVDSLLKPDHALRRLSEQTLISRQSRGPVSVIFGDSGERLVMSHAVSDPKGELVGIMLVARNLEYLSQVQSTIRYSRKLAALGRLSAGVAHEVKNPLNAMMIHLELLRQQFASQPARAVVAAGGGATFVEAEPGDGGIDGHDGNAVLQHVEVIANEIRRLDEVVQGFLKFTRPEDLKLQPLSLTALFEEVIPIVRPEADRSGVQLNLLCADVPDVNGDPAMLRQAFLNLALNACQAMPNGGTLRIHCEAARGRRVAVSFTDTGVGIKPEHLQRIFDLYYTTKQKGSGIGLSMVYRTVQMHDGEIEVQSTPGAGSTFRVLLPQA
jgi:signal transduction histidine kinase